MITVHFLPIFNDNDAPNKNVNIELNVKIIVNTLWIPELPKIFFVNKELNVSTALKDKNQKKIAIKISRQFLNLLSFPL